MSFLRQMYRLEDKKTSHTKRIKLQRKQHINVTKKKVKKVEEGQLDYYKTFAMFLLSSAKCQFYFGSSEKCFLFLTITCHLRDVCKKGNNKLKKNSKKTSNDPKWRQVDIPLGQ